MSSDLVIVYHRQPYEEVEVDGVVEYRENASPNGIVPTLKSFFGRADGGSWVAWKQSETDRPTFERVVTITDSFGEYRVARLPLTSAQVTSFYHVTSKEAMWPILHSFKERYDYDNVDWPTFREVNWAFAEAAASEVSDDGIIWVHDYNLWLVPEYVRKIKPNAKIAFFHHTPFPAADMFNVMPWRGEIINSLLCCDIVGFHIPRYANNFASAARSLLDCEIVQEEKVRPEFSSHGMALSEETAVTKMHYQGRDILLTTLPVGVDTDYIREVALSDETEEKLAQIKEDLRGNRLILSVGRTDYTKGGIEQLLTFERLLERRPELIGHVRLMFVSVAANRNMVAYEAVQSEIETAVGRINGRFGTFEWQPIALLSNKVPFKELVAYYRACDTCWITPLCDGFNLVAHEFVAARKFGSGVLVLSEFTGAAVELDEAVLTNPFSNRSMDLAIDQALDMPLEERQARMRRLKEKVERLNIKAWGEGHSEIFDKLREA